MTDGLHNLAAEALYPAKALQLLNNATDWMAERGNPLSRVGR
jgi:hypothetical protein